MFTDDILKDPIKNKEEFEKMFNYTEIAIFKGGSFTNTVILENGYAKSKIINKQEWQTNIDNRKVTQIDIIFTKYPFQKQDWITNYHTLLADRLKELFAIDPSLNNAEIKWNLVLQTDCKTASLAKQYFHGILIKYEIIKEETKIFPVKEELKTTNKLVVPIDTTDDNSNSNPIDENFAPDYSNTRVFKKQKKKHKAKPPDLPKCPDYK